MILPIYTFGHPILRETTVEVKEDSPSLQALIDDMIETMHGANGVGLAAPQVGRTERLFTVDLSGLAEEIEEERGALPEWAQGPMVFINPDVVPDDAGPASRLEEGCLSIPDVREDVVRPERIRVRYLDRHFEEQEMEADDMLGRVIQHEFDHLRGVLFLDYLSPLRKRLLRRRLREMAAGEVEADYPLATAPV